MNIQQTIIILKTTQALNNISQMLLTGKKMKFGKTVYIRNGNEVT